MNHTLTLCAGPLKCRLQFGDCITEKNVRKRYRGFLNDDLTENIMEILPSSDLVPGDEEFNLRCRITEKGFCFFSSSTDGCFDPASSSGLLNISTSRCDNPATVENALRCLFGILAFARGFVFLHAAACSLGDKAWIFLGPSGSGKSTVASFARERGYKILSDDLVLLGIEEQTLRVFSSPFFGEFRTGIKRRESFAVEGIYLLYKSGINSFSLIDSVPEKAMHLLSNVPFTELCDKNTLSRILSIAEGIVRKVRLYRIRFTNSPAFLDLLGLEPPKLGPQRPRRVKWPICHS